MLGRSNRTLDRLSAQLQATTLRGGTGGDRIAARVLTGATPAPASAGPRPPDDGAADQSQLDGEQVRALTQFGKAVCGLKVPAHAMLPRCASKPEVW